MSRSVFDPKNSFWLEVVRIFGITINILLVISGVTAVLLDYIDILYFLILLIFVAFLHLINMLSLNAFYNLQELRINSEKTYVVQKEILSSLKKGSDSNESGNHIALENTVIEKNIKGYEQKSSKIRTAKANVSKPISNGNGNQNNVAEKRAEVGKVPSEAEKDHVEHKEPEILNHHPIYGKLFTPIEEINNVVKISEEFDAIGEYAFKNNSILEDVYISRSIKYILLQAFYGCSNLKNVYYQGTEAEWSEIKIYAFNDALLEANFIFNVKN